MEDSDWRDVIDNNLNGTANTIRAFAPKMVAQKKGSDPGALVDAGQARHERRRELFSLQMGHSRPHEIRGHGARAAYGITVNAVIPGLVDTALTRYEKRLSESVGETGQKVESPTPQEAWDNRAPTVPMRVGWLQPDDISPVAVFLASDAAALVTGAEYEVTAGDSAKDI